ncbi:hypothetical protein FH972_026274 [Carpinus fangiana]|uniref:Swiss Army Knife RNA repair protein HAD domain-containing protein n=1 Tax=Carpinus fangiana TaxID=176857 RepID=A0A5N6L3V9_9ROSI|nr:hypothetical protein FH972_026274 [Carpinus fangiana]
MTGNVSAFQANGATRNNTHTVASIQRWSCGDNDPPRADTIRQLHVYDFDNTLFASPLPNRQLWKIEQIGQLYGQDVFANGGWWHDPGILGATGEGVEKEEPRAWAGWWNEEIVQLVELSMAQQDTLTVLLTGRSEPRFQDLINRMLVSKKLVFDLVVLKPEAGPSNENFSSTMNFKQTFLDALLKTYSAATEICLYEDRIKHVHEFREFFVRTTAIKATVIEVAERATSLNPTAEVAAIQRMLNAHNAVFASNPQSLPSNRRKPLALRRTVFYTGYLISPADTARLLALANLPPRGPAASNTRTLANSIMIRFGTAGGPILDRAGGLGHALRWRCTATGALVSRGGTVWAARCEPVPANAPFYCEGQPVVVLALQGGAKGFEASRIHAWQNLPAAKQIEFDTVVGEKVLLRIEEEVRGGGGSQRTPGKQQGQTGSKRPFQEEDFPTLPPTGPAADGKKAQLQQNRGPPTGPKNSTGAGGRGGGNGGRGGGGGKGGRGGHGRGGRGGGRGKGGYYHSLDDVGGSGKKGGPGYDGADDGGLTY